MKEAVNDRPSNDDGVESKREYLAILAFGTTREFLGVDMTLGDVKKSCLQMVSINTLNDIKLYQEIRLPGLIASHLFYSVLCGTYPAINIYR